MNISSVVVGVVAVMGCGSEKTPRATTDVPARSVIARAGSAADAAVAGTVPSLFTDAEVASRVDDLTKRLAANAARTCALPMVMAETLPGSVGDELIQLFEGTGALATCIGKVSALPMGKELRAAVDRHDAALVAFDRECGATIADAVQRAAAHVEGCSPYQIGVRREPDLDRVIQIIDALEIHARALAAHGKQFDAVELGIAAIRVSHDLMRGHVSAMALGYIGATAAQITSTYLASLLDTAKLTKAQYDVVARQLDALLDAMPRWGDLAAGERDSMDVVFGATLMPKGWAPPGGWNEGLEPVAERHDSPTKSDWDPRDQPAALLAATADSAADLAKRCSAGASYLACHDAVDAVSASVRRARRDREDTAFEDEDTFREAVERNAPVSEAVRGRLRDFKVLEIRSAVEVDAKGLRKVAFVAAQLAAVRLQVEIKRRGKCPTAAALAAEPYAALVSPAVLGDALALTSTTKAIEVRPPAWTKATTTWTIRCAL